MKVHLYDARELPSLLKLGDRIEFSDGYCWYEGIFEGMCACRHKLGCKLIGECPGRVVVHTDSHPYCLLYSRKFGNSKDREKDKWMVPFKTDLVKMTINSIRLL